jgi:hypothetical protein
MDSCLSRSVLLAQLAYGQFNRHADSEQRVFRLSGASVYLFTCSLFGVAMGIGALMIAHCVFFSVLLGFFVSTVVHGVRAGSFGWASDALKEEVRKQRIFGLKALIQ